ncbi:MAG: cytochrome c biogenesis protein CcsA, partial [Candidatus Nealsonbacteria bacterium]|nr:cytochrome c biogenesis protein CcsA [Candidatus Nealsonbacteria bacterium]
SFLLAVVAVLIGFAAGLMYLEQARRLKNKLPPIRGLRLPSLEWLERTNGRAIVVSLLMLCLGVLSGMVLNRIGKDDTNRSLPWYDPVVLSALLMFGWLLIAALGGKLYRPTHKGRKVAYLTLVSFAFLAIALAMVLFSETQHGGKRGKESKPSAHYPLSTTHAPLSTAHCFPPSPSGGRG